jgi:hypothetical protein
MSIMRITDLESKVRQKLDSNFPKDSPNSLPLLCDQVEEFLLSLTEILIIREIQLIAEETGSNFVGSDSQYFLYDYNTFYIKASENQRYNNLLEVIVNSVDRRKSMLAKKSTTVSLDTLGRFNKVHIKTSAVFENNQSSFAQIVRVILESGYYWLTERVRVTLNDFHQQTSEDLYSYLRQLFPEQIVNHIWLYAVVNNRGLYIPSALNREFAFKRVSRRLLDVKDSPIKLAADFSTRLIEFDKLFCKLTYAQGQTMVFNFDRAKYASSCFHIAEEAIYQSNTFVSQPLVREGKTLLSAAYPVSLRDSIEPILTRERENIKSILEKKHKILSDIVEKLREKHFLNNLLPKLFEFAGAFLKGLAEH